MTLGDGVFPLVALAEGKDAAAYAVLRTGGGRPPPVSVRPAELDRRVLGYDTLVPAASVALPERREDRVVRLSLTGGMMGYDWRIDGARFDHTSVAHVVAAGQRVRLDYVNDTRMFHPMHLHGHTFALGGPSGSRKDTALVLPGRTVSTWFDADSPGRWMVHCHNAYHAEAGMMTLLGYQA
ncbi:multicopper oxidase domain-containing protein [Catellatospora coxensis]|uniref:Plastocyanin-like domain-containing protein n=1 Tax=Catellatospora coxensis TaxID=310354 RepID=A0A8J3KQZ4_9ACTN|nr:multicopper oxidase domain-containing protein [Catellatospora coxensis]GIG05585.1 hypothetical protein Cco03nite_22850 [Catellatospora coxensis]